MSSGARSVARFGVVDEPAEASWLSTNLVPWPPLVEKPVDAGHRGRLPSGIRTGVDARVTRSARGTGKPGHEPNGPGKTKTRPRCETMRTPGAASRGWTAREPLEACRGATA